MQDQRHDNFFANQMDGEHFRASLLTPDIGAEVGVKTWENVRGAANDTVNSHLQSAGFVNEWPSTEQTGTGSSAVSVSTGTIISNGGQHRRSAGSGSTAFRADVIDDINTASRNDSLSTQNLDWSFDVMRDFVLPPVDFGDQVTAPDPAITDISWAYPAAWFTYPSLHDNQNFSLFDSSSTPAVYSTSNFPPQPAALAPPARSAGRHVCPHCGRVFRRNYELTRHMISVHRLNQQPFLCQEPGCDRGAPRGRWLGYSRRDKLQEHMRLKHSEI